MLGCRYYRNARGTLFQARAEEVARGLNLAVSREVENLHDWMLLSNLSAAVVTAVDHFIAPATPGDDICLVTVDVMAVEAPLQGPSQLSGRALSRRA